MQEHFHHARHAAGNGEDREYREPQFADGTAGVGRPFPRHENSIGCIHFFFHRGYTSYIDIFKYLPVDKYSWNFQSTSAAAQSGPTVSGLDDFDYQNLAGLVMGHQNLSQLKTIGKIPLPPEVMEHFGRMFHAVSLLF